MGTIKNKSNFVIEFDPIGFTGFGQFLIKKNDGDKTPYAQVILGIGIDPVKSKQKALHKATEIVNALDQYYECLHTCESCELQFDINTMKTDGDDNYFCNQCFTELSPIWQQDYDKMKANGEIDDDN